MPAWKLWDRDFLRLKLQIPKNKFQTNLKMQYSMTKAFQAQNICRFFEFGSLEFV